MATIVTAPASRVMSGTPVNVTLESAETPSAPATVTLAFSSTGPNAGQTLRLQWGGVDLTFTVIVTPGANALDLPTIGALSLSAYAAAVAERLTGHEVVNTYFAVSVSGSSVILTQRTLAVVDITATSTLINCTVTVVDVPYVISGGANWAALVQVWRDTGNTATDTLLLSAHAPYRTTDRRTDLDIAPAFGTLTPALPTESSIAGIGASLPNGQAASASVRFYLRYADKWGAPSVAQYLAKSSTYMAILGAISADSGYTAGSNLRHAYRRRDAGTFIKPVTDVQPDWLYWLPPTGVTGVYLNVLVTWSDGTSSSYDPYGTTAITVADTNIYWFACGFEQLKLDDLAPSGGTDPDAYITGYTVNVKRSDGTPMLGTHSANFGVYRQGSWPALYLLFENGVGGCESVALRGKTTYKFQSTAERFERPRAKGWASLDGDSGIYAPSGNAAWVANTGWLSDPAYLEHLRQLPLANAWLIDIPNKKFRKVIVQPGEIEYKKEDETIYNLSFTITAAWADQAANV